jgi:hypothetical protein
MRRVPNACKVDYSFRSIEWAFLKRLVVWKSLYGRGEIPYNLAPGRLFLLRATRRRKFSNHPGERFEAGAEE